jgi:hypothetical protein
MPPNAGKGIHGGPKTDMCSDNSCGCSRRSWKKTLKNENIMIIYCDQFENDLLQKIVKKKPLKKML